jgi:hypothetical protein
LPGERVEARPDEPHPVERRDDDADLNHDAPVEKSGRSGPQASLHCQLVHGHRPR